MKLTAVFTLFLCMLLCTGCHYFYDSVGEVKRIPIPIPKNFPHEFVGEIYQVWVGNELQLKSENHTAYLVLEGVNNPDLGENTEEKAVEFLHSLLTEPTIKAVINATDQRKRMISNVYCGDNHINLEMVRNGWGTYDDSDCEFASELKAAEKFARSNNLGFWQE